MFRHAASEARRLGLEICIPNCSGWSSSGGPWNMPSNGNSHRLEDLVRGVAYTVRAPGKDGWYTWNPGVERTPLCETLAPEAWRKFYCLEPFFRTPRPLTPGKSRTHTLQVFVSKGAPSP